MTIAVPPRIVSLDNRFSARSGHVLLNGSQAIVRLTLLQAERDKAAGLDTAGFVSGYRGSPLAGLDKVFAGASKHLAGHRVEFRPGLNEELAMTAVWGTQQVGMFSGAKHDGVFALWYGKGAGVDRASDVLRHGNAAGSAPDGGVLVAIGDDHLAKSSSQVHACERACADHDLPLLYPADLQDLLDYGIHGWAMSRLSGSWVGLKVMTELADSTGLVDASPDRVQPVLPGIDVPPSGLHIRWPDNPGDQERRQKQHRLPAVHAYVRANGLDRPVWRNGVSSIGVVASGKSWQDLREALHLLGIDEDRARQLGLALFKVAMPWPLEPEGMAAFAEGLGEVLVVEEKEPVIEAQLRDLVFDWPIGKRPVVSGKRRHGDPLLPKSGEVTPEAVAAAIARVLTDRAPDRELDEQIAKLDAARAPSRDLAPADVLRTPYFCSGCPHNTSTKVPAGSRAVGGIGCHAMAMWGMERETTTWTAMGGEGATWIGQASFTEQRHVFANLGDGTYFHSGILAVRAAVAAGVSMTYKILFNDAVAMTGGQSVDGTLTVPKLVRQLQAEGVEEVVVVADDPSKYGRGEGFPQGLAVEHRDELDGVQRRLREAAGVTVIVYDQVCAAETRRRRKRDKFPASNRQVFINEAVCEGCGDCSVQSNCLSIEPKETPFGRKRAINQASCNTDLSCLKGFCPSFVTVDAGLKRPQRVVDTPPRAPNPAIPALGAPYRVLVSGVGGTGVITISAVLAMAAHVEGTAVGVLDQTGLAQKGGAVVSHLHLALRQVDITALKVGAAQADLVLGCDAVVTAAPDVLSRMAPGRTRVLLNRDVTPTGAFTRAPDLQFSDALLTQRIRQVAGKDGVETLPMTRLAREILGDEIGANLLAVGFAFQQSLLPLQAASIEQAIELNGAAVAMNLAAFRWGRALAADPALLASRKSLEAAAPETLEEAVTRSRAFLTDYQNAAYASRYSVLVERAERAEAALGEGRALTDAVARSFFKLLAYKDEYEVARLHADDTFKADLARQFGPDAKPRFHLAPPFLTGTDLATGRPRKREFGSWMLPVFGFLARLRFLRGTPLDPFGRTAERRAERAMAADFEREMSAIAYGLTPANHAIAVEIARLPQSVRGFGPVKDAAARKAAAERAALMARFDWQERHPSLTAAE